MINVKSDEGNVVGHAYGNPAQITVELSLIVAYVLCGMGDSIPKDMRKGVLKTFLGTIYDNALNEIEKL